VARARRRIDDTLSGEGVDPATVRALRVLAEEIDDMSGKVDAAANRILTIGGGVLGTVISTAILLALRS